MIFRAAEPADAEPLCAMARACFTDTFGTLYPPADLAAFLDDTFGPRGLAAQIGDPRFSIRVVVDMDAIVGFAKIGPNAFVDHADAGAVELYQLYVLKEWQGSGIAQQLMEWTIERARAAGAPQVVLSVYVDNLRAQRFYARYGFREVGRYAFPVGDTIDDDRVWRLEL